MERSVVGIDIGSHRILVLVAEVAETGETQIVFRIDYEFRNLVLKMLAKNNLDLAVRKIMDAFIAEADRRYARVAQPG